MKRVFSKVLALSLFIIGASVAINACSQHSPRELALVRDPQDDEAERLSRLQMIRVYNSTTAKWESLTAESVAGIMRGRCIFGPADACGNIVKAAQVDLCAAHLLTDAAGLRPTPLKISDSNGATEWEIPQQSASSQVALLRQALRLTKSAASSGATFTAGGACASSLSGPNGWGSQLVGIISEAYYLYRETVDKMSSAVVGYADFQTSHPSVGVAQERGKYAAQLSRSEAAHLWVGGDPGLPATFKFCTSPELRGAARTALETWRHAGISPADLTNKAVLTTTLLETGTVNGASVKARLAKFWDNQALAGAGARPLTDQLGVGLTDFDAARSYLTQEFKAFSRSKDAKLEVDAVGTGTNNYTRWAGTSSEPAAMPDAYYEAIAGAQTANEASKLPSVSDANSYAEFVDAMGDFIGRMQPVLFSTEIDKFNVLDPLALIMTDISRERVARWTMDTIGGVTKVAGFSATDGLYLLVGDDVARCASTGAIEGAGCRLAQIFESGPTGWVFPISFPAPVSPPSGFNVAVWSDPDPDVTSAISAIPAGTHVYLGQAIGGFSPGRFKILSGMTMVANAVETNSVVPNAAHEAAKIIAPSTKWCAQPTVTCADTKFDERLPLENELSQDNDGIESSWKHYLALARTAATQADQLGEAYIQAGIDQDLRGESNELREKANDVQMMDSLNELQSICGTNVDPVALMDVFKDLSIMHSAGARLGCTVDSDCASGMKCYGGQCTPDPLALASTKLPIEQYNRLSRCLESSNVLPFVTVGDLPVCIWQNKKDSNDICSGYSDAFTPTDHPCPDYASQNANGDGGWNCSKMGIPNTSYAVAPVIDKQLGYFHPSETLPARSGTKASCDDVRRLRKQIDDGTITKDTAAGYVAGIRASEMFHPATLAGVARRIGWTYHLGGYSAITVDGEERYRTGDAWRGAEGFTWPCNAGAKPASCAPMPAVPATPTTPGTPAMPAGSGLFCSTIDCSSANSNARTDITKMNERMYRAVEAVRLMALDGNGKGITRPKWMPVEGTNKNLLFPKPQVSGSRLRAGSTIPVSVVSFVSDSDRCDAACNAALGNYVGYRVNSAVFSDTLAWWSSVFSYSTFGHKAPGAFDMQLGLADGTGLLERSANDVGVSLNGNTYVTKTIFYEVTAAEIPDAVETKKTAWWDGLSSAVKVGNAPYAGYFYDVLRGGRPATQVDVDRLDPASFDQFDAVNLTDFILWKERAMQANFPQELATVRPFDYEPQSLLDGLELLCDVEAGATQSCDPTKAPQIRNADDLAFAKDYLSCVAGTISQQGGRTLLAKLPSSAFDALRKESGVGSFPANGGDLGTKISALRAALVGIAEVQPKLAGEVRGLGLDLDSLRISLVRAGIKDQMSDIQFMATASAQLASVASGLYGGNPFSALSTGMSALAQINFASQLNELAKKDSQFERELQINNFAQIFSTRAQNLDRYSKELSEHLEAIDSNLSDLEVTRDKARRALSKAIFMNSSVASNTMNINDAYRRRYNTANLRYQAAFKNARRLAFIAKRAIEQRLGVRFADMTEALALVEAPSTWEQSVCTSTGVSYAQVRFSNGSGGTSSTTSSAQGNYADAYIGDYVTRLENLVESYRLAFDFHEGTDTAVISLRDDVQHVRAACDTAVDNLLTYSGALAQRSTTTAAGWDHVGCTTTTTDGVISELPNCIDVYATGQTVLSPLSREGGVPMVNLVTFGNGNGSTCTAPTCGWVAASGLAQKVRLLSGKYVLSWYADPMMAEAMDAAGYVSVRGADGGLIASTVSGNEGTVIAPANLKRYYMVFSVPTDVDATIQIRAPGTARQIKIGAFQLERAFVPTPTSARGYVETTGTRTRVLKTCEDTDGREFRASRWQRACVNLCPDGFNSQCDASQATPYCYRESTFSVNQRDIDGGKLLVSSGFARGNFNYRLDTIGLNFVGTGTRDCTNSPTPSSCSGGGFIPYSLYHTGPFYVRNHTGDDVKVALFNGRIEHARGLATERYITNPMSSSDRDLLSSFTRQEFQGRPLDGNFTIRVWDEPGVDFDAIQDVQIVLNYRYWTRFD